MDQRRQTVDFKSGLAMNQSDDLESDHLDQFASEKEEVISELDEISSKVTLLMRDSLFPLVSLFFHV